MTQPPATDAPADLLRTELRIGMERAAEMLSRFLQPRYSFRIRLSAAPAEPPEGPPQARATVRLTFEGVLDGAMLLQFSADSACRLAGLLLRREPPGDLCGEPLRSTLKEFGNIFASGVLASLDDRMQLRALPLPPTFLTGSRWEREEPCPATGQRGDPLPVQARLECCSPRGVQLEGEIIIRVSAESLRQIGAEKGPAGVDPAACS